MAKEAAKGVPAMVETLRKPPLTPYSLPVVERFTQTLEYFVHHEDIRRAQPGWHRARCRTRTSTSCGHC